MRVVSIASVVVVTAAGTLVAAPLAAHATAAYPMCFGERATIVAKAKQSVINGTPRRDVIVAGDVPAVIHGGKGNDLICGQNNAYEDEDDDFSDRIYGGPGNDKMTGKGGDDELYGGSGSDLLYGRSGADVLVDGAGDDIAYGGSGTDSFHTGRGSNRLIGGPSTEDPASNTVSFTAALGGVHVDLGARTATGKGTAEHLRSIGNADGSPYNDVIAGTNNANFLTGGCGDDVIKGRDGNDRIQGNSFVLYGFCPAASSTDDDTLIGGNGNDEFDGVIPSDIGTDTIDAGPGDDNLEAAGGSEDFDGGDGMDSFYTFGYDGSAGMQMDLAAGTYSIGSDSNTIANVEQVFGTDNADTIYGDDLANHINGQGGADNLYGRAGDDILIATGGSVDGGADTDSCLANVTINCEQLGYAEK